MVHSHHHLLGGSACKASSFKIVLETATASLSEHFLDGSAMPMEAIHCLSRNHKVPREPFVEEPL